MATEQCKISFAITYTSSQPLIAARASYKIQGSADTPYIHNITPIPASGSTISLPHISVPGNYDLTVELTDASGNTVSENSKFKIGNCSGKNQPTVSIEWTDSLESDRLCTNSVCNYTIKVNANDLDNDIEKIGILKKVNEGPWNIFISNLLTGASIGSITKTFTDVIDMPGKAEYKAIVTDKKSNTVYSNKLSYTKDETSICSYLSNFKNARLDITSVPINQNEWVVATVDVNASAIGKAMNLSFEVYYRRCSDGFNNTVEVLGTDNESLKDIKVYNIVPDRDTGHYSDSLVYTPTKAGQIKLRISKYSTFYSTGDRPAYLHIDSQLLFLDKENVCGTLSVEHNFSISGGLDCDSSME